jgi:hypothetical protein
MKPIKGFTAKAIHFYKRAKAYTPQRIFRIPIYNAENLRVYRTMFLYLYSCLRNGRRESYAAFLKKSQPKLSAVVIRNHCNKRIGNY